MITVLQALLAALLGSQAADPEATPEAESPETQGERVRVVELFTSQACPMCPGANELLEDMGEADGGVLALAYGVNYWDGFYDWTDPYAQEAFVARQEAYVAAGETRRVFTPHFVVNGAPEKLRYSEETVREAVVDAPGLDIPLSLSSDGEVITVQLGSMIRTSSAEIWAVAYEPGAEVMRIGGGPNEGRDMHHYNMVKGLERVGQWSGDALTLTLDDPGEALATAVLVQDGPGGRILAAARLD